MVEFARLTQNCHSEIGCTGFFVYFECQWLKVGGSCWTVLHACHLLSWISAPPTGLECELQSVNVFSQMHAEANSLYTDPLNLLLSQQSMTCCKCKQGHFVHDSWPFVHFNTRISCPTRKPTAKYFGWADIIHRLWIAFWCLVLFCVCFSCICTSGSLNYEIWHFLAFDSYRSGKVSVVHIVFNDF